jgi:phospholipid-binding lipoprotein MlaA
MLCGMLRRASIWLLLLALSGLAGLARADETPPAAAEVVPVADAEADLPVLPDLELEESDLFEAEFLMDEQEIPVPDPLERLNRGTFGLNQFFDLVLFDPLTRGYNFVMPDAGARAVRRFFDNLATPPILINDLLQLRGRRAGVTGARFVINTTVGLVGFFDPARKLGLARHTSDFGQTLWLYGVGSGPYLMLPLLGPSTARDGFGLIVDAALRPDMWLFGGMTVILLGAGEGFTLRAENADELRELKQSSIDYYVALRSVYWLHRQSTLEASRPPDEVTSAHETVVEEPEVEAAPEGEAIPDENGDQTEEEVSPAS